MALTEQEILSDLPQLIALYMKIKTAAADPASLQVVPPITEGDKTDLALAIAQLCTSDLMSIIRKVMDQVED